MKADQQAVSASQGISLLARALTYTREAGRTRNTLLALTIVRSAQLPCIVWAVGAIINGAISEHNPARLALSVTGFALLVAWTEITFHFRIKYSMILGERVVSALRRDVFTHTLGMPVAFFQENKAGALISRVTSDVESVRAGVQDALFVSVVQIGQMLVSALLMFIYDPVLFMIVLCVGPILWFLNRGFHKRQIRIFRAAQESFSRITAKVTEAVGGIRVTQGFFRQSENAGIFRRLVTDHSVFNVDAARNSAVFIPLLELNAQFFTATILVAGGWRALNPSIGMPIGDLVMFLFLANLFFQPVSALGNQLTVALTALAGAERIFKLLDTPASEVESGGTVSPANIAGKIEFRDVTFGYRPGVPVLHKVTFSVEPGRMIALVGHTGSGKSTIISLAAKFHLPTEGAVFIDGVSTRDISSRSLRRHLGMVTQKNFLLSGTILDNIRLAKPEVSETDVTATIEQLGCWPEIDAIGLQTVVGEDGGGISVGQRQLVCIARAMVADPRILLLDEATSAVDSRTELKIQRALTELLHGRTSFVIAHRLSTIRTADCVMVLDHGRIVEQGTHDELLKMDGVYAGMYRQFLDTAP